MTLDQIDQSLSEWQARLALAGSSLLELDDHPAYQRLRGSADRPPATLSGQTLARVGPVLTAIDDLWQSQQRLTDVITRAQSLRRSLGRLWVHDEEWRQIEFLLQGESIRLAPVAAPFAQRGLLSVAEQTQAITPERLLTRMTQDFTVVKDTVLALADAWERLGQGLAAAARDATALQALADELGAGAQPDVQAVRRRIAALRGRVASDPLGTDADFAADLSPLLGRLRAQLTDLKRQKDQLDADLGRARWLLRELDGLEQACRQTARECGEKIEAFSPAAMSVDSAESANLRTWLVSLEAARQQQWQSVRIGLARWLTAAEAVHKGLNASCRSNKDLLERREELRGLLSALQIKARAQALRGAAQPPALAGLAHEAERLLHGRPTPLDRAAVLVAEYERRLAQGEQELLCQPPGSAPSD